MTNSVTDTYLSEVRGDLRKLCCPLMLGLAAVTWLATRNAPWGLAAGLHYLALSVLLTLPVFWLAGLSENRKMVVGAGLAGVALLMLAYAWNDTYIQRWEDVNQTRYEDRHRRWGGALEYRKIRRVLDDDMGSSEGPMVGGHQHGRWIRHELRPPRDHEIWFWQGKQVSEQQWRRKSEGQ